MYIGKEEEKNILSHVDFTRLCYVMDHFSYLFIDIFTNVITFPLQSSTRGFQWREKFPTGLEKYVKQIDTSIYGDYIINDHCFC